jgi:hypothetical protein
MTYSSKGVFKAPFGHYSLPKLFGNVGLGETPPPFQLASQ